MQIKRFEAADMQDALKQVKETLGPEAIILSTKSLKTPSRRKGVEVVAALDRQVVEGPPADDRPRTSSPSLMERLASSGLKPEFFHGLIKGLPPDPQGESPVSESWKDYLHWKLMDAVDVTGPVTDGIKMWAFIGPTGVGKTTTLAKLAAQFHLQGRKKITLISLDTYRIGAIEQLKTYAEILNLPLEVAFRPEDLKRIIEFNMHQDLLLIDTVGRSPSDSKHLEELRAFLGVHPQLESHLLLSATTKDGDLERTVQRYSRIPIRSYIFTKLDETEEHAPLLNQLLRQRKPLSYLTTGQKVPEDIELATKVRVANLFLKTLWN